MNLLEPRRVNESRINFRWKIIIPSTGVSLYGKSLLDLADKVEMFVSEDGQLVVSGIAMGAAFADCLEERGYDVEVSTV